MLYEQVRTCRYNPIVCRNSGWNLTDNDVHLINCYMHVWSNYNITSIERTHTWLPQLANSCVIEEITSACKAFGDWDFVSNFSLLLDCINTSVTLVRTSITQHRHLRVDVQVLVLNRKRKNVPQEVWELQYLTFYINEVWPDLEMVVVSRIDRNQFWMPYIQQKRNISHQWAVKKNVCKFSVQIVVKTIWQHGIVL